ncbi:MAG: hypothetical protein ACYC6Z_07955 [Thermoleophilia bacterium]
MKHVRKAFLGIFFAAVLIVFATFLFNGSLPGTGYSAGVHEVNLAADGNALAGSVQEGNPDNFLLAKGSMVVAAVDMDGNLSTSSDRLKIDALISVGGNEYRLKVDQAMASDPLGLHQTWGGVGIDRPADGTDGAAATGFRAGAGDSPWLSGARAGFIAYGYGGLTCHGKTLSLGVPVRVMTISSSGFPWDAKLVLDIGFENLGPIEGLPAGQKDMRVMWQRYADEIPQGVQLEEAEQVCP